MAAGIVTLTFAGCAPLGGGESTASSDADAEIGRAIRAGLGADPALGATEIHVATFANGVVQLSGFVASPLQKVHAEAIARNTAGVRDVSDAIVLRGR